MPAGWVNSMWMIKMTMADDRYDQMGFGGVIHGGRGRAGETRVEFEIQQFTADLTMLIVF